MADNKTVGRVYTMMCPRPAIEPPPGTPELKPWDGIHRSSPIDEYIKKAQGGLGPVRADSWHYQQALSVQDAAIGEAIGAGLGKVLQFAGRLIGLGKGATKASAKTTEPNPKPPEPSGAKPPEPPVGTNGVVVRSNNSDKAAFGERAAHDKMVTKGHEPVGRTDGSYVEGHKGIDGVYKNTSPPPDYIITEVKTGDAKLAKGLADGTNQMDDVWVEKRLIGKVGESEALRIKDAMDAGKVEKWLVRVYENGTSSARIIDSSGNAILGNKGKVPGF
jgi:hypothetical protein